MNNPVPEIYSHGDILPYRMQAESVAVWFIGNDGTVAQVDKRSGEVLENITDDGNTYTMCGYIFVHEKTGVTSYNDTLLASENSPSNASLELGEPSARAQTVEPTYTYGSIEYQRRQRDKIATTLLTKHWRVGMSKSEERKLLREIMLASQRLIYQLHHDE